MDHGDREAELSPEIAAADPRSPGIGARIMIDPQDHGNPRQHAYATFEGYAPDNIWETLDGGKSWRPRTGPLPSPAPPVPLTSTSPPATAKGGRRAAARAASAIVLRPEDFPEVPVRAFAIHPRNP